MKITTNPADTYPRLMKSIHNETVFLVLRETDEKFQGVCLISDSLAYKVGTIYLTVPNDDLVDYNETIYLSNY